MENSRIVYSLINKWTVDVFSRMSEHRSNGKPNGDDRGHLTTIFLIGF